MWECQDCEQRFDPPGQPVQRPQRIFLSYGHDENQALVLELKAKLESAGHQVWIDQTHIKAGDDWRAAIKKGLLESDRVLAILSRHSTRDPGVCLDEIGIALAYRHGAIATLMVEPVEKVNPPPSISHIQYLDLSNWREVKVLGQQHWSAWVNERAQRVLEIVAQNAGFAGEMDVLQGLLKPFSQGGRLGNLLERGFVGREWVLQDIEQWRESDSQRMFCLMAGPGMGKSAIAARLAHTAALHTIAYHFCRYDEPESCNPESFVRSLAFQLAARLPGYRQLLLHAARYPSKHLHAMNAADLFTTLLSNPLRFSIDGGQRADRLLVVVDALDEAPAIAELLAKRHEELPAWMALFVSSRPETDIKAQFAGVHQYPLNAQDPRNREDVGNYIDQWLATVKPTPEPAVHQNLIERSGGNILYLVTARSGVASGVFTLTDTTHYPSGLAQLYGQWFGRQFDPDHRGAEWQASYALLELICASPEPLPIAMARNVLGWKKQDQIKARHPLGSLVQQDGATLDLCHRSLAEWLMDEDLAGLFWVNAKEGASKLATALWQCLPQLQDATEPTYGHRVLPELLVRFEIEERRKVWIEDTAIAEKLDALSEKLRSFNQLKMNQARLQIADCKLVEVQKKSNETCMPAFLDYALLVQNIQLDYTKAGDWFERIFTRCFNDLGVEHRLTADSGWGLAQHYELIGKLEDAQTAYTFTLNIREKVLGPDHPDTAKSLVDLGSILMRIGDNEHAQPLFERALKVQESTLSQEHPEIARTLYKLAHLLVGAGDSLNAGVMYERALAIQEKVLGTDHPDTAHGLNTYGLFLMRIGMMDESMMFQRRALAIWEATLGPSHPDTATGLNNLAYVLVQKGDVDEARELFVRALAIRMVLLGGDHIATQQTMRNLSSITPGMDQFT